MGFILFEYSENRNYQRFKTTVFLATNFTNTTNNESIAIQKASLSDKNQRSRFLIVLCQLLQKTSFHRSSLKTAERLLYCRKLAFH
jgi:hypothetical protein